MEFIEKYQEKLREIYQREKLICLSDHEIVKFDNKNAMQFLQDNCSKIRNIVNKNGIFDEIENDIILSISHDIKFSLGNIYLYKELKINNFLTEKRVLPNGRTTTTYHSTLGERQFLFYVSVCFEKLYNFWDRIGDLIELCFQLNIGTRNIYFQAVIDKIKETHSQSNNFRTLKEFLDNDYKSILNKKRKLIVHHRQEDTYFRFEWARKRSDEEAMEKLQKEKDERPELLKKQMQLTISGFEAAVRLIGEIN